MTGRRLGRPTTAMLVVLGVWGAGFLAPTLHLGLLHLTPALLLVTTLLAGRYPGEVTQETVFLIGETK